MSNGLFPEYDEDSIFFSRSDVLQEFAAWSKHAFELEGKQWPSVEHYYQAMKFKKEADQEKVRLAESPKLARKLGRSRLRKIRKDWKKIKVVIMTRAVYTKCRTYPEIAQKLLDTEDRKLVENSQYDYFWGCGRDRRGGNQYGNVLMSVRKKLKQENSA